MNKQPSQEEMELMTHYRLKNAPSWCYVFECELEEIPHQIKTSLDLEDGDIILSVDVERSKDNGLYTAYVWYCHISDIEDVEEGTQA